MQVNQWVWEWACSGHTSAECLLFSVPDLLESPWTSISFNTIKLLHCNLNKHCSLQKQDLVIYTYRFFFLSLIKLYCHFNESYMRACHGIEEGITKYAFSLILYPFKIYFLYTFVKGGFPDIAVSERQQELPWPHLEQTSHRENGDSSERNSGC